MSMEFGFYVAAIGVGLVFAALLAVAILSKVLTGVFKGGGEPVGEGGNEKVAAVAAVIAAMGENSEYGSGTTRDGSSRWEAAARMEAIDRGDER